MTSRGKIEEELLQNPVIPKPKLMTHRECVEAATEYLSKRCNVVLPEFYSWNGELADVIGFASRHSVVIECKVSRSDFIKDQTKQFRAKPERGMGDYRYYCCPKGLIEKDELPKGWGLLWIYPSGAVRMVKGSHYPADLDADLSKDWLRGGKFPKDKDAEYHLLYYYARRANYAGVHKTILEYRGFDK